MRAGDTVIITKVTGTAYCPVTGVEPRAIVPGVSDLTPGIFMFL